jgi:hypothetical protein
MRPQGFVAPCRVRFTAFKSIAVGFWVGKLSRARAYFADGKVHRVDDAAFLIFAGAYALSVRKIYGGSK